MFQRQILAVMRQRAKESRRFIQVLAGPRQVGKTTLAHQLLAGIGPAGFYASADGPLLEAAGWIEEQWSRARIAAPNHGSTGVVLILDEIHKIQGWAETVKRLWDKDTREGTPLKLFLLGSSPMLIQRGLTESLAGRFEVIRATHWSFDEMESAFGWDLPRYLFYGGYPGAAPLIDDRDRWGQYILESLIETTISRDVLLMTRINRPALLRRLFQLGCEYSAQILSYQKMLGQLQESGNTTTLAHYLDLLAGVGMVAGIEKYSTAHHRRRGSSPKLLALNTALLTAPSAFTLSEARMDPQFWGRLVETAVGAHLMAGTEGTNALVYYWRDRNREVDFVLKHGDTLVALEVKSGRRPVSLPGMGAFAKTFRPARTLLVGADGIPVDEFLRTPVMSYLR
ncbi:MAG: ATP-binding protein [Candidatus Eisenbacteria sp.]|nr:ATP-binding protein [Candidatus Eisenbacteria bacterium]